MGGPGGVLQSGGQPAAKRQSKAPLLCKVRASGDAGKTLDTVSTAYVNLKLFQNKSLFRKGGAPQGHRTGPHFYPPVVHPCGRQQPQGPCLQCPHPNCPSLLGPEGWGWGREQGPRGCCPQCPVVSWLSGQGRSGLRWTSGAANGLPELRPRPCSPKLSWGPRSPPTKVGSAGWASSHLPWPLSKPGPSL